MILLIYKEPSSNTNYIQINYSNNSEIDISAKKFINCLDLFLEILIIKKPIEKKDLEKSIKNYHKRTKFVKMILNTTTKFQKAKKCNIFVCFNRKKQNKLLDGLICILRNVINGVLELETKIKNIRYSEDIQQNPFVTFEKYTFKNLENPFVTSEEYNFKRLEARIGKKLQISKRSHNKDLNGLNDFFNEFLSEIYLLYETLCNNDLQISYTFESIEKFKDMAPVSLEYLLKTSKSFLMNLEGESSSESSFEIIQS